MSKFIAAALGVPDAAITVAASAGAQNFPIARSRSPCRIRSAVTEAVEPSRARYD